VLEIGILLALLAGIVALAIAMAREAGERPARTVDAAAEGYARAAEYSQRTGGLALVVLEDGRRVFEQYAPSHGPDKAHRLASGTKSFWGVLAAAAHQDGVLRLDERVSETLTEWRSDPRKREVTIRQLLNFTSGLDPQRKELRGARIRDKLEYAVDIPLKAAPGAEFTYGPSHLAVFGEVLARKLAQKGMKADPLHYLQRRILDPIGVEVARWNRDASGHPIMAAGAFLTAREWADFGQLIVNGGEWHDRSIVREDLLMQLFQGSRANPFYGLTFWLNGGPTAVEGADLSRGAKRWLSRTDQGFIWRDGPKDLVMAAGSGSQRMYIIPSLKLVVVRQAEKSKKFSDVDLLEALLGSAPHATGKDHGT
jgi:CubicO group peptidase (beta-lactamase class C family)